MHMLTNRCKQPATLGISIPVASTGAFSDSLLPNPVNLVHSAPRATIARYAIAVSERRDTTAEAHARRQLGGSSSADAFLN